MYRRRELLADVDKIRRDIDTQGSISGLDKFYVDAIEMVTSNKALAAFDIAKEDAKLRDEYGRNDLGQSCLLARRLVPVVPPFRSHRAAHLRPQPDHGAVTAPRSPQIGPNGRRLGRDAAVGEDEAES